MPRRQPEPSRPPASEQYFASAPSVESAPRRVRVNVGDLNIELDTDRGVFSHGRLDTGTELLLRQGGVPDCGEGDHLLDLGCGAGPVAAVLALRAPSATVWAVDVNERARQLCAANARRLGLERIHVVAPDEVPDTVRFREIWSNPPIRIGKAALHELLNRWLGRLTPTGQAMMVVQRHLGADSLAAWLQAQGYQVTRMASAKGYRVLRLQPRRIDDHPAP